MTSFLKKMSQPEFVQYLDNAIPEYARENVESGRWQPEGAVERSRSDHERLLPEGIETKNNYLFNIISPTDDCNVGSLWLSIEEHDQNNSAFIYDIEVNPRYRRKGFATSALNEIEDIVKGLGIETLGLHVFRHNISAEKLYTSLGYNIVSTNMAKSLA
jgi:ribosomal protein S18 acetylase RimI-like enzyme